MELIERYLQAVQFWLPRDQKDDIIAELSEDLHAQIEEKEARLGRALTEAEIGEVLKQRGRPVLVANRFVPQEHLIGPVLFPIFMFVQKIVMLSYLAPWMLTLLGRLIYSPTYRGEFVSDPISAVLSTWSNLWATAFFAFGSVTIVFAILERLQKKSHFLEKWEPAKLPPVRNPNVVTRATASFELFVNAVGAIVWATNMYSPVRMITDVKIFVSPMWPWFFWGFLLVSLANLALSAVSLTRPHWTTLRAIARLVSDAAGSALFCWLLKANILTGFGTPNVSPERAIEITNILNYWTRWAFPIAVAMGLVIAGANIYRIVRLRTAKARPAFQAIVH